MAPKALFPTIFVLFHPIANLFLPNALAAGKNPGNKGSSEIGGGQGSSPNKNNAETTAGGDKNKSEGLQESKDQQSSSPPSPKTKIKNNSPNIGNLEQGPLFSGKGNVKQQEANLPKKGKEESKIRDPKRGDDKNEDKGKLPASSHSSQAVPGSIESKIRDPKRGDDKNKDKGKLPASSHSSQAVPGSIGNFEQDKLFPRNENVQQQPQANLGGKGKEELKKDKQIQNEDKQAEPSPSSGTRKPGPNIGNLEQGPLFSREGNVKQPEANLPKKGKEVSKTSETKHGKDEDKDKDKKQRDDDKNNNGGTPPASSGASKKAK